MLSIAVAYSCRLQYGETWNDSCWYVSFTCKSTLTPAASSPPSYLQSTPSRQIQLSLLAAKPPLLPPLPRNSSTQYMTLSLPLYRGLARLCSKVYLLVAHSSPFCATSAHATEPCLLNLNVARLASPISADRAIFFEPQTRSTCKITTLLQPRAILARVPYKQTKQPSLPAPAPSRPIKPRPYEKLPSRLHRRN